MESVSKVNRFVAYLIDSIVAYVPAMVMAFVSGATGIDMLIWVGYALYLAYFLFRDALMGGQSIGKKAMKFRAVKEDETSLNGDFAASATRSISALIPIINLVDCFFVLTDKPRLGDGWAKTKVVNG